MDFSPGSGRSRACGPSSSRAACCRPALSRPSHRPHCSARAATAVSEDTAGTDAAERQRRGSGPQKAAEEGRQRTGVYAAQSSMPSSPGPLNSCFPAASVNFPPFSCTPMKKIGVPWLVAPLLQSLLVTTRVLPPLGSPGIEPKYPEVTNSWAAELSIGVFGVCNQLRRGQHAAIGCGGLGAPLKR